MPKLDHNAFEVLGQMIRPPAPPPKLKDEMWAPPLMPAQQKLFDSQAKFILAWSEKGCRTGTTQLYADDGLIRLQRLRPENAQAGFNYIKQGVVSFDGKKMVPGAAGAFWVETDRSAFVCELDNGAEITGSPRHPLWVCAQSPTGEFGFSYVAFSEMAEKKAVGWRYWTPFMGHPKWDRVALQSVPATVHPNAVKNVPLTEDLAYAVGALVGDGSLNFKNDNRVVGFTNQDSECLARVARGLAEIETKLVRGRKSFEYSVQPAANIKPLIRALDLVHLSYHKTIPDAVIESPKPVAAAFLRGLFDTDGTVEKPGTVSFTTTSKFLALDTQDLLAAFGILAARRPKKSASGNPTWNLTICGLHAHRFGQLIGFEITRKQNRIAAPRVSFRCPHGFNHNRYGFPDPIKVAWRKAWHEAKIPKRKADCDRMKRLCSFGSIPARAKINEVIGMFGGAAHFEPFLVSDNWLEIKSLKPTEAELFDLNVPGTNSFLAAGTINHNSGKTWAALEKLVRHCFENDNALALILVRVRSMANKGGAWDKLQTEILPEWKKGLGLAFSEVKQDSQHNEFMWIANQYGGWSMVVLISAPHSMQLRERIRGYEPSFVFVDELTSCDSVEYFQSVAAQIGRRPHIDTVQQFVAATNPEGPTHWVYQKWFVEPFDAETGACDPDFENIYFPIAENEKNLTPGYLSSLDKIFKSDATEAARMIKGEWVDRPSGEGLFREIYNVVVHVRPLNEEQHPDQRSRLLPDPKHVMVIGIDPGSVNNAFVFMQRLPIDGKDVWTVFDEIVTIRRKIPFTDMIPLVMRRIKWWREQVGEDMPMVWIADEAAFNQYRQQSGSFDVMQVEQIYEAHRAKYGLEPLGRIKPCPKGGGSIVTRVRLMQQILSNQEIIVSSSCRQLQQMFLRIEGTKMKSGEAPDPDKLMTPGRSDHKHVFDALSYPIQYASVNPTALVPIQKTDQMLIQGAA